MPASYELCRNLMVQNRIHLHFNYALSSSDFAQKVRRQAWQFALYRARHETDTFRQFSYWQADLNENRIWQRDSSLYGQQVFTAFAGVYDWIFEGYNNVTQTYFRYQFTDTIPDMNPRRLTMGDVQLGFFDTSRTEMLASIPQIPNAGHTFSRQERVVISFYVNGLDTLDQENGLLIRYTITPLEESKTVWETLGSIFIGDDEVNLGVSISNEYPVRAGEQYIKQMLDIKNLSPSRYILNVEIEELASKRNLSRTKEFKIQ